MTNSETQARERVLTNLARVRRCVLLSAPARLVLLQLCDLDMVAETGASGRPPTLAVTPSLIDCDLPKRQVTAAIHELARFRLLTVEHVPGPLDLRLTLHFAAIEKLLGAASPKRGGGSGSSDAGGGSTGRTATASPQGRSQFAAIETAVHSSDKTHTMTRCRVPVKPVNLRKTG